MKRAGKFFAVLVVIGLLAIATFVSLAGKFATCATNVVVSGTTKLLESFDKAQLGYLSLANNIGLELKLSEKDRVTALAVMIQESRARNLRGGDRDSLGLFQQRPIVKAWGTAAQILDPNHATRAFYEALMQIDNRELKTPLELALKVQRPSPEAYASPDNFFPGWIDDATAFVRRAASPSTAVNASAAAPASVATAAQIDQASLCSIGGAAGLASKVPLIGGKAGSGTLRYPTSDTTIDSNFGMRFHPVLHYMRLHDGVDFSVPTGTPIYAAAAGTVVQVRRSTGLGNYIQLEHAGCLETGYAHLSRYALGMQVGSTVSAGQLIGYAGSTGRVTGPHLHFRVLECGNFVNPRNYL